MTVGRPTKYNAEIAQRLAEEISHKSLEKACEAVDINESTYYEWLYKHEEFSKLSTLARKTKAVKHYNECEQILEEIKQDPNNPENRSDIMRLRLDFHLRLAGKANQGLFGDSAANVQLNIEHKDVGVPGRMSKEEWEKEENQKN